MKKFTIYLKESEEVQSEEDISLDNEIRNMIKRSLNTEDNNTVNDFIAAYKRNSEENQIEGLINNSDVWDFYLKYSDDIDEILNNNDYYSKSPQELNIYSLYDYIILGTKEAVNYIINGFGNEKNKSDF